MANPIDFELLLKDQKFQEALRKAVRSVKKVDRGLKQTQKTSKNSFKTGRILKFGVALVGVQTAALAVRKGLQLMIRAATGSVKTFAKFEKEMLSVRTLLDETSFAGKTAGEGFKQMGKEMTKVLQDIPINASDASKALFDITSAQIGAADATKVLVAAGKLAVAGNARVSTTTQAVVKSIVAFNLNAKDATNIAAKFFTAQKLGLTTVEELSKGIGLVAAQASQMGVSLDEVLGSIVGTTRGALGTRRAFVGLAAAFKNIIKPGKEAKETAKEFGIELSEAGVKAAGGFIPFLVDLNKKAKGSSKVLSTIFAQARAFKQVSALLTKSGTKGATDAIDKLGNATENTKTLTDNYAIAVKGLSAQWDKFTNNTGEVQKALVEGLAPAFKDVLSDATSSLQKLFDEIKTPEVQASLKNLGDSIFKMFQGLKRLTPKLQTFITSLGGLVEIGSSITNSLASIGEGSEVSFTKAAVASQKLIEAENALSEVQRRRAIDGNQAFMLRGQEESLKKLIKHLQLKVTALNLAEKEVKIIRSMSSTEATLLKNRLDHIAKERGARADAAQAREKDARTAEGNAEIAANRAKILAAEVEEAELESMAKVADKRLKAIESANKIADAFIQAAQFIGLSEIEIADRTLRIKADKIKEALDQNLIAEETALQAIEALKLSHADKVAAAEKKARDKKEAEEEALIVRIIGFASKAASALSSGTRVQGEVTSTQSAAEKASSELSGLQKPDTQSTAKADKAVKQGEKEVKDLQKDIRSISTSISNSDSKSFKQDRRNQQADLKNRLAAAKTKLSEDKKVASEAKKESKSRESAITKGLDKVKEANISVDEAIKSRDQEARANVTGGLASGAGIAATVAFGPAIGGAVASAAGPIIEALTGDPEDAKAFIESIVDQIPVLIEALADNMPVIINALARAMPSVALALVKAIPLLIPAILESTVAIFEGSFSGLDDVWKSILEDTKLFRKLAGEVFSDLGVKLKDVIVDAIVGPFRLIAKMLDKIFGSNAEKALNSGVDKLSAGFGKIGKGKAPKLATGGFVTGQGNRDTVPAVLTPGELVVDRTTGPRLNRFLDSAEGAGAVQGTSGGSENKEMLARILSEVLKPVQVEAEVKINEDVFADIILDLNRRNARLA